MSCALKEWGMRRGKKRRLSGALWSVVILSASAWGACGHAGVERAVSGALAVRLAGLDADCAWRPLFVAACAVHQATRGVDWGWELFDAWSATGRRKYRGPHDTWALWSSLDAEHPSPITLASLGRVPALPGARRAADTERGRTLPQRIAQRGHIANVG